MRIEDELFWLSVDTLRGKENVMGKLETFDKKQTNWIGLWWNAELNCFCSPEFNLAMLKGFKGTVRLYARKNKFYNNGQNGRPNYCFCIKDSSSMNPVDLIDEPKEELQKPKVPSLIDRPNFERQLESFSIKAFVQQFKYLACKINEIIKYLDETE